MVGVWTDAAGLVSWVLNATVATSVLVLIGAVVAWRMRGRSASARHVVWVGALACAVLVPAISLVVPWRWDTAGYAPPMELRRGESAATATEPLERAEPIEVVAPSGAAVEEVPRRGWPSPSPSLVLLVWVAGVAAVLVWLGIGAATLARLRARARYVESDRRIARVARRAGLRSAVRVGEAPGLRVPVTAGVLRPTVLLPSGALADWPVSRLRAVLLHEFAHVRRADVLAHLLGRLACAIHWFNPLVWRTAKRAARESERACDDAVLLSGARASSYASHVLEIARSAAGWRVPAPAVGQGSELEGRLLAVLAPDARRTPATRRTTVAAGLVIVALSAAIATHAGVVVAAPPSTPEAVKVGEPAPPSAAAELTVALTQLLTDTHAEVRSAAARSLGELRAADAIAALATALSDESERVREHAALALGAIESPAAVPALAGVLATDRVHDVREAAAWALGETESDAAVEALAAALATERSRGIRVHIVEALGQTKAESAVPALGEALADPDSRVRRAALVGLSTIGSASAAELLLGALRSEDAELRRSAARALGEEGRK